MNGKDEQHDGQLFKRLMELKKLYEIQQKELGISTTGRDIKNSRFAPDTSSESEIEENGVDKEQEVEKSASEQDKDDFEDDDDDELDSRKSSILARNKKRNPRPKQEKDPMSSAATSVQQLQATIKGIIERHGGSCHLETIVEHVKMKWQKEEVLKPDGQPYGHADCKKAVQANFRTRANNRFVFSRDRENEGCWTVTSSEEEVRDRYETDQSLASMVTECIEEHGGTCHLDDIYTYIHENWIAKPLSDGTELTEQETELNIRITLSTNPKFVEDPDNPDNYQISHRKKRKLLPPTKPEVPRGKRPKVEDDPDVEVISIYRSTRRSNNATSPPPGYTCRCGATDPGDGSVKWKKGTGGEFLCNSCGIQYNKKHACPVCGKVYRKTDLEEEENAWIRCDDCHRWVMTKCDNIEDLSVYDDSNPNHLHYSCPLCRGELVKKLEDKTELT